VRRKRGEHRSHRIDLKRGAAWRVVAWRSATWRGMTRHCKAWRGVVWCGVAWRGVAWRGGPVAGGGGDSRWRWQSVAVAGGGIERRLHRQAVAPAMAVLYFGAVEDGTVFVSLSLPVHKHERHGSGGVRGTGCTLRATWLGAMWDRSQPQEHGVLRRRHCGAIS
jgi:hypothetical protein